MVWRWWNTKSGSWTTFELRQPRMIAVEDEAERWEIVVHFYEEDWAWGHGQDRHEAVRAR